MIVLGKYFKTIASVVCLVAVIENHERSLATLVENILTSLRVTAAHMIVHHSVNYISIFENPSQWSTFNKRIVSEKNFKAISSVVYPSVGVTSF